MSDPVFEALNRAAEELSPQYLDLVIAYIRKQRANFDSGVKPKKIEAVDLVKALDIKPSYASGPIRRL